MRSNLGRKLSIGTRMMISRHHKDFSGELNPNWKGDRVGYNALHMWIAKMFGKAYECVYCGVNRFEKRIEWASISHKAKRDLDDYMSLCVKCHREYDKNPVAVRV